MGESIKRMLTCGCIDDLRPPESDEDTPADRQELSEMMNRHVQRQEERLASVQERLDSARKEQSTIEALNRNVEAFKRLDKSPPPYVTPPSTIIRSDAVVHPNAPRASPGRLFDVESERVNFLSDPTGQTNARMLYSRTASRRKVWTFSFTSSKVLRIHQPVVHKHDQ